MSDEAREIERLRGEVAHLKAEIARVMETSFVAPQHKARMAVPGAREFQIRTDRTGREVRFADARLGDLLGRDLSDVQGKPLADLDVLPRAHGLLEQVVEEALGREGRTVTRTHEWTQDGASEVRHVEVRATATSTGVVLLLADETRRKRLEHWFGRYASRTLLDELLERPDDFEAPREVEATLLFCDLANYSGSAARLTPPEVGRLLNTFFREGIRVVEAHRGMVVQFVGDELMVVFGAPLASPTHALDATRCARALLDQHETVKASWRAQGLPELGVRIGLATGRALAGNLGDSRRSSWCVVGHPTNLAARMLTAAEPGEALATLELALAVEALPPAPSEPPRPRFLRLPEPVRAKNMGAVSACRVLAP